MESRRSLVANAKVDFRPARRRAIPAHASRNYHRFGLRNNRVAVIDPEASFVTVCFTVTNFGRAAVEISVAWRETASGIS